MAEIDPRRPGFGHLVEQVISEQLQEVPVARLRPRWILLKPGAPPRPGGGGHRLVTTASLHCGGHGLEVVLTPVAR